jgi:hypothetical protein
MRFPALLASLFLLLAAACARAEAPFTKFSVLLLQPSAVLEERVPSVDAMAAYIKAVEVAAGEAVIASEARQAVGGFIVIAVRPGPRSKVWLDFDVLLDLRLRQQFIDRIEAVKPFEAIKGPVVFALKVATWTGRESKRPAPAPAEWRQASGPGAPLEVGELVERIWKD